MNALAPFAPGDIFVTASDLDETARFPTGQGKILQFASDWMPKASFETGQKGLISSLTVDRHGNLIALDPQARARTIIGSDGQPKTMLEKLPPIALGSMIVLPDSSYLIGEHMVGEIPGFAGRGKVYRISDNGTILAEYDTETNGGMGGFLGVTHMALSSDGQTLFHTSETGAHVYAHDLVANRRLGPVYSRSDPPPMVFGIAAMADDSLLIACGNEIRRVTPGSDAARSYALPEGRGWAVPVLRGDGSRFWALDFFGGRLACVDSESGSVIEQKDLGLAKCLTGIAEFPSSAN
jgi:hypothetical protein